MFKLSPLWSVGALQAWLCLQHSLSTSLLSAIKCFRLILYFLSPILESAISSRNCGSFTWKRVCRKHDTLTLGHSSLGMVIRAMPWRWRPMPPWLFLCVCVCFFCLSITLPLPRAEGGLCSSFCKCMCDVITQYRSTRADSAELKELGTELGSKSLVKSSSLTWPSFLHL